MILAPLLLATALQSPPAALDDFLAAARRGTARFRTPDSARAAGYRPVGPDFPGMGRHWVNPSLILRDTLDAAAPPVLEYAEIAGRVTLVGVAYAMLVRDGGRPPEGPAPTDRWHFHQGTVAEESFLRSHAGLHEHTAGPKIAVLHAWVWLDNPDGVLATDNWALPYARVGLDPPPTLSRSAARALALGADEGGRMYMEALLHAVGRPSDEEMAALAAVVQRHHAMAHARASSTVALEACWHALWDDVRTVVRPEAWERLAAAR